MHIIHLFLQTDLPVNDTFFAGESLSELAQTSEPSGNNSRPIQNIFASNNFFKKVLESSHNRNTVHKHYRTLGSPEVHRIVLICSLYHTALNTLTQLQLDMLTGNLTNKKKH